MNTRKQLERETRVVAQNAQLKTVQVTIQAVTVNDKQMTLAVFRQLREEALLSEDTGMLAGKPWGMVNYHTGVGCDEQKSLEHLHVIWEEDGELRRSVVWAPDYWMRCILDDKLSFVGRDNVGRVGGSLLFWAEWLGLSDGLEALACSLAEEGWRPLDWRALSVRTLAVEERLRPSISVPVNVDGDFRVVVNNRLINLWYGREVGDWRRDFNIHELETTGELRDAFQNEFHKVRERVSAYTVAYDVLAVLPQLFIAV